MFCLIVSDRHHSLLAAHPSTNFVVAHTSTKVLLRMDMVFSPYFEDRVVCFFMTALSFGVRLNCGTAAETREMTASFALTRLNFSRFE